MTNRLAGSCALIVFAFCLVQGIRADNSFGTTVWRALAGMAATFGVGLIVGFVAQRMLDENVKTEEQKLKNQSEGAVNDR